MYNDLKSSCRSQRTEWLWIAFAILAMFTTFFTFRLSQSQGQAKICPVIWCLVVVNIETTRSEKRCLVVISCLSIRRQNACSVFIPHFGWKAPVFRAVIKWGEITRLTLGELFCARDIWTDKVRSSPDKETFYWANPQSFIGYGEMKEPSPFLVQFEGSFKWLYAYFWYLDTFSTSVGQWPCGCFLRHASVSSTYPCKLVGW